ncbi:GNAT family N-acetyltransferase [Alicyclobacillus mengziensis]|uniref:GNAT family N-acetyltransferase n=1 Tax=Alicyclobacillus mengziensis TaxID=2931921 RepID=A0A9X7VW84_9BACL|nr:GNAT family N-acetyltransferase [Alicyclobacillus mengziensis]QSO46027.1 GNAT family N-acetyltransferase [Alicyclobacillus mengziensis]
MEIRFASSADLLDVARVNVDVWKSTYRGVISDSFLDSLSYDRSRERFLRMLARPETPSFIVVADSTDGIIGYAHAGASRERALCPRVDSELYGLYLRPAYHRQGLGEKLVKTAATELVRRGYQSMAVVVFTRNANARRFYEAMGARPLVERASGIRGELVKELLYVFEDITEVGKRGESE